MDLADRALEDPGPDRKVLDETLDSEDLVALPGPVVDPDLAHSRPPPGAACANFDARPASSSEKWQAAA